LRDSIGNMVKVMIYHVPFVGVEGRMQHLIGVREEGDGCDVPAHRALHAHTDSVAALVSDTPKHAAVSDSAGDTGSTVTNTPGEHTMTADVFVEDRLPIESATHGFRSTFGVGEADSGGGFLDFVADGMGDEVMAWIQGRVWRVLRGELAPPLMETFGKAPMRTAAGTDVMLLRVCFPPPPEQGAYRVSLNVAMLKRRRSGGGGTSPVVEAQLLGQSSSSSSAPSLVPL